MVQKMKKIFLILLGLAGFVVADDAFYQSALTLGTNIVLTGTTNTVAGTELKLQRPGPTARIWLKQKGIAATSGTDGLVYVFSLGFDSSTNATINSEHWTASTIRVTTTPQGATEYWASDDFDLRGATHITPTAIINISGGIVTNTAAYITYQPRD